MLFISILLLFLFFPEIMLFLFTWLLNLLFLFITFLYTFFISWFLLFWIFTINFIIFFLFTHLELHPTYLCLLDILYSYHAFIGNLPENYFEFKKMLADTKLTFIDTKFVALNETGICGKETKL